MREWNVNIKVPPKIRFGGTSASTIAESLLYAGGADVRAKRKSRHPATHAHVVPFALAEMSERRTEWVKNVPGSE